MPAVLRAAGSSDFMEKKKPLITTRDLVMIAFMAAILCVCSWITIPFTIPCTMQTFGVFCSVLLLGGFQGTLSIILYLLLGIIGLPVFSGFQAGIGHVLGPTGGYMVGFLLTGLAFILMKPLIDKNRRFRYLALIIGLVACYLFGSLWFWVVYTSKGQTMGLWKILTICVLPYIIPDLLKMALAVFVCDRVRRLIPRSS